MIKRSTAIMYMSISIILSSLAQLSMKASMVFLASHSAQTTSYLQLLFAPDIIIWLLIGLGCYAISLVCWLFAISRLDLSLAYPMLSLSYVLVYLVAINLPILHETLSWTRSLGILIVAIGIIFIARSDGHNKVSNQD